MHVHSSSCMTLISSSSSEVGTMDTQRLSCSLFFLNLFGLSERLYIASAHLPTYRCSPMDLLGWSVSMGSLSLINLQTLLVTGHHFPYCNMQKDQPTYLLKQATRIIRPMIHHHLTPEPNTICLFHARFYSHARIVR